MHPARILGMPLTLKCRRLMRRFVKEARDPRATQERVLLEKIRRNADSAYGREYGFGALRAVEDFRRRLPLGDYETFRPWVERVKRGETRAMFGPGEDVRMFALTSGTEGRPKFIPVTRTFLAEYRIGWHLWGIAADTAHRPMYDHTICRIVSPKDDSYTEGGIPCGAISGLITEDLPWYIRRKYVPPLAAGYVKHAASRYYVIARLAVERNVSMMSSANPSTVLAVAAAADENREKILRDVRDGRLDSALELEPESRRKLARFLKPNPKRARELEQIVRRTGRLLPRDYWPELELLANWKGGSCGIYLSRYPEYFGDTAIRDIGLLATEGRMTLPFRDEGSSGALDVGRHFFEFIPEADAESANPSTLLAHELEQGGRYFMIVTTSSGLYRYNLFDLVRVTGFFEKTPEVEFLNKGAHFSSVTGEKVSEHQVVAVLEQARATMGWSPLDVLWSPMTGNPARYSLSVESQESVPRCDWRRFLAEFESKLREQNIEYKSKRDSGRLGEPVLHLLIPGAFERLRDRHLDATRGRREQYKHRFITGEIGFHLKLPVTDTIQMK